MAQPGAVQTKWSDDAFLNQLRDLGDALADTCARDLPKVRELEGVFSKMRSDAALPSELPEAFRTYLTQAQPSLDLSDLDERDIARLRRGQQVLMTNALPAVLVLLTKSLQEGYQSPRLGKVLLMYGGLQKATYRRVLGVLQMLLQVCTPGSFERGPKARQAFGDAALMAAKVRLMHAGMRRVARAKFEHFSSVYGGAPISLEDMLATLIGFSALVMDGFETLGVSLSPEDQESYYFVWRVYARTMGIHPPGQQKSWEYVPENLAEAREFYASYQRRHYRGRAENPEGAVLARANLRMLNRKMPPFMARIYMNQLMGSKACEALGVRPVSRFLFPATWALLSFPRVWIALWRVIDRRKGGAAKHADLTARVLQRLVIMEYKEGVPTFRVPDNIEGIDEVVRGMKPGGTTGRAQFVTEVFPKELEEIRKRRAALGLEGPRLSERPSANLGLVGLALSGGGIRSATFALGVVQAMARYGCLQAVDYLSTVSGGGFTGAALSSVLNDPSVGLSGGKSLAQSAAEGATATAGRREPPESDPAPVKKVFPFDYEPGAVEPPAIRHLRNGGAYLTGAGIVDQARLPAILIRGLLLNALLVLPYIMFAAVATFVLFPYLQRYRALEYAVYVTLVVFLTVVLSYPALAWIYGRDRKWTDRNRTENIQIISLLALASTVVLGLIDGPITQAITRNWTGSREWLADQLRDPLGIEDAWKWALLAALGFAAVRAVTLTKTLRSRSNQVFVFIIGLLAPALVFGVYLLTLVLIARSPYLPQDRAADLTRFAGIAAIKADTVSDALWDDLKARGILLDSTNARIFFDHRVDGRDTVDAWTIVDWPEARHRPADAAVVASLVSSGDSARRVALEGELAAAVVKGDSSIDLGRHFGADSIHDAVRRRYLASSDRIAFARDSLLLHFDSAIAHAARAREGRTPRMYVITRRDSHLKTPLVLHDDQFGRQPRDWWFAGAALLLYLMNRLWLNVNITGPYGYWRDRLSRAFLFRAPMYSRVVPKDDEKLSELGSENPAVPYHLLNSSLNLAGSRVEDLPGRGSDFFVFSKRFVGSYATGYCETTAMEDVDPELNLGTAMAISAAAASPNMGATTIKPLVFAMTLLNVRLGYWLPNPWFVQASSLVRRLMIKAKPGPWYMIREAMGALHARGSFVNVSDGGHIENLGAYELLRRRCEVIVVSDAEADPEMTSPSLNQLIRYARVDLGIEIRIDLSKLRPGADGFSKSHWALGTIRYGEGDTGYLLYIKASVTSDEPPYVLDYRGRHPAFPQESTLQQTFAEAQFESYRALGYHAMNSALKEAVGYEKQDDSNQASGKDTVSRAFGLENAAFTGQYEATPKSTRAVVPPPLSPPPSPRG